MKKIRIPFYSALVLLATMHRAFAYDFVPTDVEWQLWPEYCKARYVAFPPGNVPYWQSRVTPDMVQRSSDALGQCYGSVHHYCAGIAKFTRAGTPGYDRKYTMIQAISEYNFVRNNCDPKNPFWSNNESHMAMALWEIGEKLKAMQAVDEAIKNNPTYDGSYIAKSVLLKRSGKKSEALQVLMDGNAATNGESAEIHNALGLALLDAKQYEAAQEHARKAYEMGYPLPLLRDKLRAAGHPL